MLKIPWNAHWMLHILDRILHPDFNLFPSTAYSTHWIHEDIIWKGKDKQANHLDQKKKTHDKDEVRQ